MSGNAKNYYPDERGFDVAKGYRRDKAATSRSGHWIKALYIDPGSPWENGYVESFHDKFRRECLNR